MPAQSSELRGLADTAVSIDTLTSPELGPVRVALQDASRFDVEDRCRERLNWPADVDPTCTFSITTVIDEQGAVGLVRVEETTADALTALCGALAECVAEDRLQHRFPLPSDHRGSLAVSQTMRTKPLNKHFDDPEYVNNMILTLQDDLNESIELATTPDLQLAVLTQENYIAYLQQRLERLRERSQSDAPDE